MKLSNIVLTFYELKTNRAELTECIQKQCVLNLCNINVSVIVDGFFLLLLYSSFDSTTTLLNVCSTICRAFDNIQLINEKRKINFFFYTHRLLINYRFDFKAQLNCFSFNFLAIK